MKTEKWNYAKIQFGRVNSIIFLAYTFLLSIFGGLFLSDELVVIGWIFLGISIPIALFCLGFLYYSKTTERLEQFESFTKQLKFILSRYNLDWIKEGVVWK